MLVPLTWLSRRAPWVALLGAIVAAVWLREPGWAWAGLAALVCVVALLGALRAGAGGRAVALVTLLLTGGLGIGQARIARLERDWPAEREQRVTRAYDRLSGELEATLHATEQLAERGLALADGDRAAAFAGLQRALPRDGPETAVVILEPTGAPFAWAGRSRVAPRLNGDSLDARFDRFYATLESRKKSASSGRVVVASVLIWADSAVPRPDRSLAARFGASAAVQLRVFPPGAAPAGGDVFDYAQPTSIGDRVLFSLQPVSPTESAAASEVIARASRDVAWLLLLLLVVGELAAASSAERLVLVAGAVWCVLFAPVGPAIGLDDLFSPATFHRTLLRPATESAGNLMVVSTAILLFSLWLGSRRFQRRWWVVAPGLLLLVGAPYLVSDLGRGIIPPPGGVTTHLWIIWQLALSLATSAVIVLAGALLFGSDGTRPRAWGAGAGALIAVAAAAVGILVWEPRVGWPEWYTFLWLPALYLVARPAPRWARIAGTATVAGTAACLVTWGAELNARIVAAERDVARLGAVADDLAKPYLERFGDQVLAGPEPTAASSLYVLWRSSLLAGQEFPVRMGLWRSDGSRLEELDLDALDLPASLLSALVRGLDSTTSRSITSVDRIPGRYYILLQRLPSGRILSCAVGPRSRLLAPARLARLLRAPAEGAPLYELSLSPPFNAELAAPPPVAWHRSGTEVREERVINFADGTRHVYALVELRPLPLLLIRDVLLVLTDFWVIAVLWGLATLRPGALRERLALRRLARSFQFRLAVALALFFVVPAVGFAVWGIRRLNAEADRTRDLLITSVLRDAVVTAGTLLDEPSDYIADGLVDLSDRLQADLVLYSGGRLVAASAPILEDLSLVEPLVDGRIFQRLTAGDELELTRQATTYVAPVRVGYRVVQGGPPGTIGILATPQLAYDWSRSQDQRELTYILLFATMAGVAAALIGAQFASGALSRPVADLRRSAAAVGQGLPLPPASQPPTEFEQVFGAFERMALDIRASRAALDDARRRTAAVLANVATAVVALDPAGRVILANGRARQLFETPLKEGDPLAVQLGAAWAPVLEVVSAFAAQSAPEHSTEVQVGARTLRLQLARLGEAAEGSVLAIDDLTDVTHAARVLAWGEMARQVAHEIKNPLTPIRLGIQHLRRVRRDRPEQLQHAMEETADRILSEIDRLDTIARAFSRFGVPGGAVEPLESVDLAAVAREVAALYRLAPDATEIEVEGPELVRAPGRRDEIKEVLGNLLQNARDAGARRIVIVVGPGTLEVRDDGRGIAPELLPRIFEPRFSTTTSGSGLGLAIVRRLVEGWGATVQVASDPGRGTTFSVRW